MTNLYPSLSLRSRVSGRHDRREPALRVIGRFQLVPAEQHQVVSARGRGERGGAAGAVGARHERQPRTHDRHTEQEAAEEVSGVQAIAELMRGF